MAGGPQSTGIEPCHNHQPVARGSVTGQSVAQGRGFVNSVTRSAVSHNAYALASGLLSARAEGANWQLLAVSGMVLECAAVGFQRSQSGKAAEEKWGAGLW